MTPSASRNARWDPVDSLSAVASDTSSVIGIGHNVPSASRMSAQTASWSLEVMNPASGENPPLSSSSRSQS